MRLKSTDSFQYPKIYAKYLAIMAKWSQQD